MDRLRNLFCRAVLRVFAPGQSEIALSRNGVRPLRSRISERAFELSDLLGRRAVNLDTPELQRFLAGKRVLVSGAGGSIGSEICRQMMRFCPQRVLLVERTENNLFEIDRELRERWVGADIRPCIADVCDARRINQIFQSEKPQVVFHCAAHKHVPMMEHNPCEAIKNNIFGTKTVADAALAHEASAFVLISTDKAVNPSSVMGATKRVAEIYIQSLNAAPTNRRGDEESGHADAVTRGRGEEESGHGDAVTRGRGEEESGHGDAVTRGRGEEKSGHADAVTRGRGEEEEPKLLISASPRPRVSASPQSASPKRASAQQTRFLAVRFGNVLGSSGSVVPIFQKQIDLGGPVTVTHPEMKRYFMTIPEASQLVMQAGAIGKGGEVLVLDMGSQVRIVDLARQLILRNGLKPDEDILINFTGIRPGEKLYEELCCDDEQTRPTSHAKIRAWQLPPVSRDEVAASLGLLAEAAESSPTAAVEALAQVVPEFRPESLRNPSRPPISLKLVAPQAGDIEEAAA